MWIIPSQLKTSFLTVQESEESKPDLNEVAYQLKQSLFWKSKPLSWQIWLRKWKSVYWLRHLFGQILKLSMHDRFVTAYTESLVAIRVSHSATPDNAKALTMKDTFSRIYWNRLKQSDRNGFSLKMSQGIYPWDMKKYAEAYQILATELRKESLLRRKLARPIDESGSLFSELCKTPVSSDGEGGVLQIIDSSNAKYKLRDQAPHWTTPTGNANTGAWQPAAGGSPNLQYQVKNWLTPTAMIQEQDLQIFNIRKERALAKHINGNGCGENLGHSIQKWPTPVAHETRLGYQDRENGKKGSQESLTTVVINTSFPQVKEHISTHGKSPALLNPAWSIQLMGTTLQKTFTALLVIRLWSKQQN